MSGNHCRMRTINGEPCAQHYDCDDYADGVITSVITGEVVEP